MRFVNIFRSIFALSAMAVVAVASAADAAADFSIAANPNGVWSYGYSTSLTGPLVLDTQTESLLSGSIEAWLGNIASDGNPGVYKNTTNADINLSTVTFAANGLLLHPGPTAEYSTVRFTASAAGLYSYSSFFRGQDSTSTDVHLVSTILGVSTSLYSSAVNGFGNTVTTSGSILLGAGDSLDLRVGDGGNGFGHDSTGANLTINAVPEPASFAVVGLGALGLLRRRKSAR